MRIRRKKLKPSRPPWRKHSSVFPAQSQSSVADRLVATLFVIIARKEFVPTMCLLALFLLEIEVMKPPKSEALADYEALESCSDSLVVFYNIFLPPEADSFRNALRMIEEQLGFVSSVAKTHRTGGRNVTVLYNTIGERSLRRKYVDRVCSVRNDITCLPLRLHQQEGFEEVTLQNMYEYCQRYPERTVVYMHSKGTYHKWDENDRWRRHMTAAVTSKDCFEAVSLENSPCNVCGLLFYPLWTFFFPGNFFAASCSYVLRLIPPKDFPQRMQLLGKKALDMAQHGRFSDNLYPINNAGNLGVERYSAEHWIANHPTIQPCDMSEADDIMYWRTRDRSVIPSAKKALDPMFRWSMAPRHGIHSPNWYRLDQEKLKRVLTSRVLYASEYFLLGGHLWKWKTLYKSKPVFGSWIWDWFPYGRDWRDGNIKIVEELTVSR